MKLRAKPFVLAGTLAAALFSHVAAAKMVSMENCLAEIVDWGGAKYCHVVSFTETSVTNRCARGNGIRPLAPNVTYVFAWSAGTGWTCDRSDWVSDLKDFIRETF